MYAVAIYVSPSAFSITAVTMHLPTYCRSQLRHSYAVSACRSPADQHLTASLSALNNAAVERDLLDLALLADEFRQLLPIALDVNSNV